MIFLSQPKDFKMKFEIVSCFLEHNDKVLFLHRQDHKPEGNTWGVPAGKVDAGENIIEAIQREIVEEIQYKIDSEKLDYFDKLFVRYPSYDFVYHIFHHICERMPVVVLNSDEHKDSCWVEPQQALEMNLIPDEDACIKLFFKDRLQK